MILYLLTSLLCEWYVYHPTPRVDTIKVSPRSYHLILEEVRRAKGIKIIGYYQERTLEDSAKIKLDKVDDCRYIRNMHPRDPRNNPNHRERGQKKFSQTYTDIAEFLGLSEGHVKRLCYRGKLNPGDLDSIMMYRENKRRKK